MQEAQEMSVSVGMEVLGKREQCRRQRCEDDEEAPWSTRFAQAGSILHLLLFVRRLSVFISSSLLLFILMLVCVEHPAVLSTFLFWSGLVK